MAPVERDVRDSRKVHVRKHYGPVSEETGDYDQSSFDERQARRYARAPRESQIMFCSYLCFEKDRIIIRAPSMGLEGY